MDEIDNTSRGKLKANSAQERITKWKEHFSNLLGKPPVTNERPIINVIGNTLPIDTGDFTRKELVECMKTIANGKKAGLDNIPVEAWKTEALIEPLLDVCNKTLHGDKADIWVKSGLVPLPKKGNLGYADQYRGISLSVIAAKMYNKMLLFRIRPHIEPILRNNQNGFRPKRSTVGQILTLRRLMEGIKSKNLSAVLTFVDFSKAFDSIHRGKLMQILQAYGIPDSIVSAINILYEDTMAQVLSPDGDTEFFKILAGVLQGDTLAPFLFIVALDYAMRIATSIPTETGFTLAPCRSKRHQAIIITDSDFADDIALISDNLEKAQLLLLRVEIAADIIGLHVNEKKTKFMIMNDLEGDLLTLQGNELERVDDFEYLGSWINNTERDMKIRIAKAWSALNKMDVVWKSTLNRDIKISFFRATVESVLLYGAESWTLTKTLQTRLNGTYTRLLRSALGISWKQHKTNKELYGELPLVSDTLKLRRLRFIGHCWRRKDETVHQLLLWEPPHGRRSRGRPCFTYIDQLAEDTGLEKDQLVTAMDNRVEWCRLVKDVRVLSIQ